MRDRRWPRRPRRSRARRAKAARRTAAAASAPARRPRPARRPTCSTPARSPRPARGRSSGARDGDGRGRGPRGPGPAPGPQPAPVGQAPPVSTASDAPDDDRRPRRGDLDLVGEPAARRPRLPDARASGSGTSPRLLADGAGLAADHPAAGGRRRADADVVVGIEARGFLLGAAVAQSLGAGRRRRAQGGQAAAVAARRTYELEYGTATLELPADVAAPRGRGCCSSTTCWPPAAPRPRRAQLVEGAGRRRRGVRGGARAAGPRGPRPPRRPRRARPARALTGPPPTADRPPVARPGRARARVGRTVTHAYRSADDRSSDRAADRPDTRRAGISWMDSGRDGSPDAGPGRRPEGRGRRVSQDVDATGTPLATRPAPRGRRGRRERRTRTPSSTPPASRPPRRSAPPARRRPRAGCAPASPAG